VSASGQFNLIRDIRPLEVAINRGEYRTSDEYALVSLQLMSVMGKVPDVLGHPLQTKKLHGLSPRANYTDRATAACRRSDCQLLRILGATW
jgi:hypothetical protein